MLFTGLEEVEERLRHCIIPIYNEPVGAIFFNLKDKHVQFYDPEESKEQIRKHRNDRDMWFGVLYTTKFTAKDLNEDLFFFMRLHEEEPRALLIPTDNQLKGEGKDLLLVYKHTYSPFGHVNFGAEIV